MLDVIRSLFMGTGVAHSVMLVAFVIAIGLALSKIKIGSISLGVTWILFMGIFMGHLGCVLDETTSHFVKEFGLILFIYSIGLQVGPGFFASFRKGGITLNLLATGIVLLGGVTAYAIHLIFGVDLYAMIGVLYGAVTNTPGLGAAQQTYADMLNGVSNPVFAQGYAVAYPLGVVGIILSIALLKYVFRINFNKEEELCESNQKKMVESLHAEMIEIRNEGVCGKTIFEMQQLAGRNCVVSRILHSDNQDISLADGSTKLKMGDVLFLVAQPRDLEAFVVLLGRRVEGDELKNYNTTFTDQLTRESMVLTNPHLNGKQLGDLKLRNTFNVNITRINRAGVDLVASSSLVLQMGDVLVVVGSKDNLRKLQPMVGDSVKELEEPHLMSVFLGIALGIVLGSLPIAFPGMPVPVKLGLAGGPLIVSILVARFGPNLKMITYTTSSANLLMRQIGICMFLAAVGISAGDGFISTVINGGYWWVVYGFFITIIPCLLVGVIARVFFKLSYFSIAGLISGAMTDPPALAYSNSLAGNDLASVAYSTVYPLTMFLRVLMAQILVIIAM